MSLHDEKVHCVGESSLICWAVDNLHIGVWSSDSLTLHFVPRWQICRPAAYKPSSSFPARCVFKPQVLSRLRWMRHQGISHWFKLLVPGQISDGSTLPFTFLNCWQQFQTASLNYQADHAAQTMQTYCQAFKPQFMSPLMWRYKNSGIRISCQIHVKTSVSHSISA